MNKRGKTMNEYDYVIYTRGFIDKNTGQGKWIALITKDKRILKILKGKKENSNEARLQVIAIANVLSKIENGKKVLLLCDSQYVTNAITRGWYNNWQVRGWQTNQGRAVQNRDIWEFLIKKISTIDLDIRWYQDYDCSPIGNKMYSMVIGL